MSESTDSWKIVENYLVDAETFGATRSEALLALCGALAGMVGNDRLNVATSYAFESVHLMREQRLK